MPDPSTLLDARLAALADPTRRAMVARLARGEASVQELAAPFSISQPAISRHLKVLEEAGLIETRIQGTARPRRLRPEALEDLWSWLGELRQTLNSNFDRLDQLLAELHPGMEDKT